jgi:hypothetical protein
MTVVAAKPKGSGEMPETELISLRILPSFGDGFEIVVTSTSGTDGDPELKLTAAFDGMLSEKESWRVELSRDDSRGLWELLEDFEVHGARSSTWGLDGTTYELAVDSGQMRVALEWWERPPDGWSGPARLVEELLRLAGPDAQALESW